jgi:hypothetical protein
VGIGGRLLTRRYKVEGTKAFYYWALFLLGLGLWCLKDGWFPSAAIIKNHGQPSWDHFYTFNRSLAIISLAASAVCAYVHRLVK